VAEATEQKPFDGKNKAIYPDWTRDTIRYRDLDPNGHVNNGSINQFFEDGRVHFRNAKMGTLGAATLTGFAIARFDATYLAALSYPGEVEIGTGVIRIGRSSYVLGQGIFSGDKCIATAEVVTVFFDPATSKSRPLPDELRAVLESTLIRAA
jgi:acyl-CoA thioester hydrolase